MKKDNNDINRSIVDCFRSKKAYNAQNALTFEELDVDVTDEIKKIILANLIKEGFVIQNSDFTIWFNQEKWDETIKDLSKKYFMILAIPFISITAIALLLTFLL